MEYTSKLTAEVVEHMGSDHTVAMAARVSTGKEDDAGRLEGLINYLVREKHTSTLEHCVVTFKIEAPIFVAREAMRHRTCVSGDTVVELTPADSLKNRRARSIATIWENWHLGVPDSKPSDRVFKLRYRKKTRDWICSYSEFDGSGGRVTKTVGPFETEAELKAALEPLRTTYRRRKLPSTRNIYAVSVDEATGRPISNRVVDVLQQGVKPVWRVTLSDGSSVKATSDHRILTADHGYQELASLKEGDLVQVLGRRGIPNPDRRYSKELRQGIGHWASTFARPALIGGRPTGTCYICEEEYDVKDLEADHVTPVAENLSLALTMSNMALACRGCHREKTNKEQRYRRGFSPVEAATRFEKVVEIVYAGEEMTYDLVMEAPFHNFLANNIVVHNCSFNEISGRYAKLEPKFYTPDITRPLVNKGTGAHPDLVHGDDSNRLLKEVYYVTREIATESFEAYESLIEQGVATEVARNVLPVSIYTRWYQTANLNNWFKFLELRQAGNAQWEIRQIANQIADALETLYPVTVAAWKKHRA